MLLRTEGYPMLVSVIETAKTVGKMLIFRMWLMERLAKGWGASAVRIKKCHFGAAVAILVIEVLRFGHSCAVDYDSIDIGSWLVLAVVIGLFLISRSWLLRLSGWVSVLLAILLPFGMFPPFGDEVEVSSLMETIQGRVVVLCVHEAVILCVAWFLLNLDYLNRKNIVNSPSGSERRV
ncbi:hypothetical protein [Ralstonia solanacearum]|uniref:Transmembrane protein n=1 Tax=Ralstonia solanacearum TaxID=305 RepID=A0AAE3NFN6_RALSL|nr:hypothetical protein [Ralstonia solanacearum]MBB6584966.1 hypothetical protein [Ralstonia solanacearum]MDB0520683.1 hypothetical protein [Ralstonia solanacearum]